MRDEKVDTELVVKFRCLLDLLEELERDSAEANVWLDWTRLATACAGELEARVCTEEQHAEDARMLELARYLRKLAEQVTAQLATPPATPGRAPS